MIYYYDNWGWLVATPNGRETDIAPPTETATKKANFTGKEWVLVTYVAPVVPVPVPIIKSWNSFDFYRKFTSTERIAMRNLAKTDGMADDFIRTLDAAIASGANTRADDPDLVAGLAYMVNKLVLAAGRPTEILSL